MSKVTAPLLSFGAAGQVGKSMVFAKWKGRPYVRQLVIPANPNSTEQQVTRNLFSWLQNAFKFAPTNVVSAYAAYADGQVMTDRNAFVKINLGPMRTDTDLANLLPSPGAKSGFPNATTTFTPAAGQITVAATAPTLPAGWSVQSMQAAAIRDQDPDSGTLFTWDSDQDLTDPYSLVLAGLAAADWLVAAWFVYTRPDGTLAYGPASTSIETVT